MGLSASDVSVFSFGSVMLYGHRGHKDYQGRGTQLLSSVISTVRYVSLTSTEAVRIIMDGGHRTSISTFTQLLSSEEGFSSMLLYFHREH